MRASDSDCDTGAIVQRTVQRTPRFEYVPTRPSSLDAACLAAGPGFAIVADAEQIRGVVVLDHERGTPLHDIPPRGFVS
jgi:hypothetical protein